MLRTNSPAPSSSRILFRLEWRDRNQTHGNKADHELELDDDCPWKLDIFVIGQSSLDVNGNTFNEGMRYLNENVEFAYFSTCAYDSTCTNTCTDTIFNEDYEIESDNAI